MIYTCQSHGPFVFCPCYSYLTSSFLLVDKLVLVDWFKSYNTNGPSLPNSGAVNAAIGAKPASEPALCAYSNYGS